MYFLSSQTTPKKKGITLLLIILILAALLSISIGIFNVIYNELRISGDLKGSFDALYAADTMLEYGFYLDRVESDKTGPGGDHTFIACTHGIAACTSWGGQNWNKAFIDQSGGFATPGTLVTGIRCGMVSIDKTSDVTLIATGLNRCDGSDRTILRAFQAVY